MNDDARSGESQRVSWQNRLLPLMASLLVLAALFFAVVSVVELRGLYERLEHRPSDLPARLAEYEKSAGEQALRSLDYLTLKVRATLEADALQRRYHQASATMLARLWTRQLGFITGMLLALVGAAFILGRLSEPATRLQLETQGAKGALETSSPGLVLAVLGAALMALTIWVPFEVETRDVNIYLVDAARPLPPPGGTLPVEIDPDAPPPANEKEIRRREEALFGQ